MAESEEELKSLLIREYKRKGETPQMTFLVMNRTQGPAKERGPGRWGCVGIFVHEGVAGRGLSEGTRLVTGHLEF